MGYSCWLLASIQADFGDDQMIKCANNAGVPSEATVEFYDQKIVKFALS